MNIDVLYFDGCPTHPGAAAMVDQVVTELGVEAVVRQVNVLTDEEAAERKFLGSPSIHVDGVDIDPGAVGRTDFGLRCRVYPSADGLAGLPPRNWLEAALLGEVLILGADSLQAAAASCCSSSACGEAEKEQTHTVALLVADWCPQCPSAKSYWSDLADEFGFELETLDIASARGAELAQQHGVRALPTAVVDDVVLGAGVARPARAVILDALGG